MERIRATHKYESQKHRLREIQRKVLSSDARTGFPSDLIKFSNTVKSGGILWPGKTSSENNEINAAFSGGIATLAISPEDLIDCVEKFKLSETDECAEIFDMISDIFSRYEDRYTVRK